MVSDLYAFYFNEFNEKVKVNFFMNKFNQVIVVNVQPQEKDIIPFGKLYYDSGEIEIGYGFKNGIKFMNTVVTGNIIEIRTQPKCDDVFARESVFLRIDVAKSDIQAYVDTEISGS